MQHQQDRCYNSYVDWIQKAMDIVFSIVHENLKSNFKKQNRYYDTKLKFRAFTPDDQVRRYYLCRAQRKIDSGWTGPYAIARKLSDITYVIENSFTGKTYVVHVDQLKKLIGDGVSENQYNSDSDEQILSMKMNQI